MEELLSSLDAKNIFFVVDKPVFEFSGAKEALKDCLKKRQVEWFSDFELNPKLEDVERGIDLFRKTTPEVVVALGGGSMLDMCKLISTCGVQEHAPVTYIKGEQILKNTAPPMIAIPTTSGTGSEATHFAVVYVEEQKYSLAHPSLLPNYVLIDPQLTYSLPPRATAACGLDALCQAVESIWAVGATEESVGFASEALELALDNIETAVNKPNAKVRAAMSRAAYLSGKAINISKTTAPHAFSYGITTQYNVPHGIAVALTLGLFMQYNYEVDPASCSDPRGAESVKSRLDHLLLLLGNGSMVQVQNKLKSILMDIGCPIRLSEVGIKSVDLPKLVNNVNIERLSNNPRKIDRVTFINLLKEIL